jgi:hypothetical protein
MASRKKPPLGWIPFADRTAAQMTAHYRAMSKMPRAFAVHGEAPDPGPKVCLTDLWKHPMVKAAIGYEYSGVHQLTGSCVGAGFGNVLFTLATVEVIKNRDPERIIQPFWLYTYGISRMLLGDRSEGEGSTGSSIAEAAREYGTIDQAESPDLPKPQNTDGLVWGNRVELEWSNGAAKDRQWTPIAKKHLVRTTAPCHSAAEVRTAVRSLYPVTMANDRFINPGSERLKGSGENAAVVGRPNSSGGHQTSILNVWDNPELGPLFFYVNQWGLKVYKQDPSTGLAMGCWMDEATMDAACRGDGEVIAYSQYDGFPAQYLDPGAIA